MFNFSIRKIGGIRFVTIGRINFQFSVSSRATFHGKRCKAARAEVIRDMINVERLCADIIRAR